MREYISDYGIVTAENALETARTYSGNVCAVYSDRFEEKFPDDFSHLTELRIFNEDGEFKLFRFDLGSPFHYRYISDEKFRESLENEKDDFLKDMNNRIFDEIQLITDERKIVVRNYLDYDVNGRLSVSDFRIVKII